MEPYIDELLDVSAELSEIKEITSLIKEVHLSYRQFTKEALRALPVKEPESSKDVRSPSVQQYKLPKTDMPVFEGDPKLWCRFWEWLNQRISMYPGIPAAEKIAQLEQASSLPMEELSSALLKAQKKSTTPVSRHCNKGTISLDVFIVLIFMTPSSITLPEQERVCIS